jgi:predicted DNA-binding transcriptional regulator
MSKDQIYGWIILLVSLGIIVGYIWVLFFPPMIDLDFLALKLTGVLAIGGGFGIMAWIGYTLATTPPPEPIDMSEFEKKTEEQPIEGESKPESKEPTTTAEETKPEGKSD